MDEDDFVNVIVNNTNQIKSLDTLKLILYLKYDMEFKGNKSRKTIVNEACYLISQKNIMKIWRMLIKINLKDSIEM